MPKTTRRRRYAAPVGALFILLAAIGLITVIVSSIQLTRRVLDNTPELEKIQNTVRPVVMWDPVPFESYADVDPTQLLYYSMWAAIMDENRGAYALDEESQGTIVPASDLEVAAANLFGEEVPLQHDTFGEFDVTYYYDAARNVYIVPTSVSLYVYSPKVDEIEKRGDLYYVRMGYLAPTGAYTINYHGNVADPQPDKYMLYILRKTGSDYHLIAVRDDERNIGETHTVVR